MANPIRSTTGFSPNSHISKLGFVSQFRRNFGNIKLVNIISVMFRLFVWTMLERYDINKNYYSTLEVIRM